MTHTALAPRGTVDAPPMGEPRQAVVVLGPPAPDWLQDWCRQTGRALQARPDISVGSVAPLTPDAPPDDYLAGRTVWIARQVPERSPRRIVTAIRRLPDDGDVLAEAVAASDYLDASLTIAHAVPLSFAERSVGLDSALAEGRRLLVAAADAAATTLPRARIDYVLVRSRPHELVGETLDADLLVLGGPGKCRRGGPGMVRRSALWHAPCPLLLVAKRTGS